MPGFFLDQSDQSDQSDSSWLERAHDVSQATSSCVQSSLDRSDRAFELITHFLERRAFEVKRPQCFTIELTELAQSISKLFDVFLSNQAFEWVVRIALQSIERIRFTAGFCRSSDGSINGQSNRDLAQPPAESLRLIELRQFSECSQEDFLNDFISLCGIAKPLHNDPEDPGFELQHEIIEGFSIAFLSSDYGFVQGFSNSIQSIQRHSCHHPCLSTHSEFCCSRRPGCNDIERMRGDQKVQ